MDTSNSDEINSNENQQLPTSKDPKGCLAMTSNHQKDDDDKKIVILNQDPKGCQDVTMGHQKDDDGKTIVILNLDLKECHITTKGHQEEDDMTKKHKNPIGCQDVTMDEQKDDHDAKKTMFLHQKPKECQDNAMDDQKVDDAKKIIVVQKDPKGCQDITTDDQKDDDTNKKVILHQDPSENQGDIIAQDRPREDDAVNETIVQQPVDNQVVPEDDDDGFKTPTSLESKIPILTTCPPAPKPIRGIKRKASPISGQRTVQLWLNYPRRFL